MRRAHEPFPEEAIPVPAKPIVVEPAAWPSAAQSTAWPSAAQSTAWPSAAQSSTEASGDSPTTQRLLMLQRTAGNRAVSNLLDEPQPSLAGQVDTLIGQRRGESLDPAVRTDMEVRLGAEFSGVRVHRGRQAEQAAAALGARAFTVGEDVVFGAGAYDPVGTRGRQTIAHELTHVMQQRRGGVEGRVAAEGLQVSDPHDRFEREATEVATAAVGPGSEPVAVAGGSTASGGSAALHAPSALVAQRVPLVGDPSATTPDPATQQHQQIVDQATRDLPIWAESFAQLWLMQANTAVDSAAEPEDAAAKLDWWVALAGNLLWAATSVVDFFNPELKAIKAVMSGIGATIGTGAAAQGPPPSGKAVVKTYLAQAHAGLVVKVRNEIIPEVADACATDGVADIEHQKQRLWAAMMPEDIRYDSRAADLLKEMSVRIARGLQQFNEQYKAWENSAEAFSQPWLAEYAKSRSEVEKRLSPPSAYEVREAWRRTHPFVAHLDF